MYGKREKQLLLITIFKYSFQYQLFLLRSWKGQLFVTAAHLAVNIFLGSMTGGIFKPWTQLREGWSWKFPNECFSSSPLSVLSACITGSLLSCLSNASGWCPVRILAISSLYTCSSTATFQSPQEALFSQHYTSPRLPIHGRRFITDVLGVTRFHRHSSQYGMRH